MEKYVPPKDSDRKDYALAAVKAAVGSIPVAGAALNELLSVLVAPSLEKRKSQWMEEVGQGLRDIESKLSSLEDLQSKENFIDIAIEASRIAISTGQEEIRNALKNAVLNAAISESVDESKQKLFLHFLDTFTEWHIRFLKLFDDPESYMREHKITLGNIYMGGISNLIDAAFPQLNGEEEFSEAIWNDIYSRKLFNTASIHGTMSASGIIARRTSDLGREFLSFII
ncbi:hypothetical protein LJC23_01375 [Desulfovibrio sp. OttesenSCG-928-I05]|nr:hypothetical protein [Desulfovibrio sp. OttesenSCG-928-I05]